MRESFFCGIVLVFLYSSSFCQTANKSGIENQEVISQHNHNLTVSAGQIGFYSQDKYSATGSVKAVVDAGLCELGYIRNNDTTVCAGSVVELYSRSALTYQWLPANSLNSSTIQNPWLVMDSTRTFYLVTTNYLENLIQNPDFELGNNGFETDYTYCSDQNCLIPLGDNGYSIGKDASYFYTPYFNGYDHTSGKGNFMIVNGGRPTLKVWRQTVPVKSNTGYTFGLWISRMNEYDTSQIRILINGAQVGPIFNPPTTTNKWEQVIRTWNSGIQTSATVEIVDVKSSVIGNDFGLDDFTFGQIISCSDSVTISASRNASLGHDTIISLGQQLVLITTGGPFNHYIWNTGDTTQSISVTEAGNYWLLATDTIGCESRDTISINSSNSFVLFPNAFTPNADRDNDVFRPVSNNVIRFHMAVFNQWGQLVFETNDIKNGWEGMINGKDCVAGLYVYAATYEFKNLRETKTARGSFTLLR